MRRLTPIVVEPTGSETGSWVSGRGRSGGAHPSLCSASICHLVGRRCLGGGGSVSFG
jgi:hypothetical protein